jgi:hypothetical protein
MNGFQTCWRGIRAQERPRTIGKKIANSIVGKSTGVRVRIALGVALALALPLLGTPPAQAGCGGVEKARPKRKVAPRPPLAIGDSSMLLALPALARVGYKVNARGCRQFSEGLSVLRDARRHHRLPHLAVLALGGDASISGGQIQQAKKILGPKRKLGLVTPRETGGGESNDAKVVRQAGQRDPERIKVLDWVHFSAGHSSWFQPDGLHLTFSGAKAFARLLKKLIPLAEPPNHKGGKRPPAASGSD